MKRKHINNVKKMIYPPLLEKKSFSAGSILKPIILSSLSLLLFACGGSKLPDPTPLSPFSPSASIKKIWSTHPNSGNNQLLFKLTPASENNTIFTAGYDGCLSAINLDNGKEIWKQRYKELHFSSNIGLANNALYLGTDNAQIVKLDQSSGNIIWTQSLPSTIMALPNASYKAVFAKTINGEITALDINTGSPIWNYQQTLPSLILRDSSDPVINKNTMLVGFANGALTAFDQSSGNIIWNKQISLPEGKTDVERMSDIAATPKIKENTVYAASYQGKLSAFNFSTGESLWSIPISTYNDFDLSDDSIFIGDSEGNVFAISQSTGTTLWKQEGLRYRYLTAPTYIGHHLLAIADKEGYLHILDSQDGHFVARISVDGSGIISRPLYLNEKIIVQSNKGRLYAYNLTLNK